MIPIPSASAAPSCRVCGRLLRSETSRARGVGPICHRRTHGTAPRIPTPHPDHHVPGQTELDLFTHQPTLWSI
ncbi:DUF6011 domain-containing protein [Streptomyces sp. NPDC018352]|uniref:DUF6011 domain-containing protein n=1 Tax=Streptomyces sp. NPDC018352 TaxID=3157194 RepID=UPI0033CD355D